jgi:hypothetical protein
MTHADFRPRKRSGVVPSGKPRRKIPLLRILLLLIIAFFVYTQFDSIWSGVRGVANPVTLWNRAFGDPPAAPSPAPRPAWSADSSAFTLDCPRGLRGCCESLPDAPGSPCREAAALMAKAHARGALAFPAGDAESPLRLHARAGLSRAGQGRFELAALQGRDRGGAFAFRRNPARGDAWCDARRGCLAAPSPQAPLAIGRLMQVTGPETGGHVARWVSASSTVHPALSGRVVAVDSGSDGARVRLYHGGELYTTYEPLRLAGGIRPGLAVTPRTALGEASWRADGYTVLLAVRRAGLSVDPSEFFSIQAREVAAPADSTADSTGAAGAGAPSATPSRGT